ncbi:hypothetical protein [Aeoliella mucimassa]|uniref:General secretion pathway, M protein n=1 Tax=Aeoliella mucimassa TaxID=2527972 RepID=A0A518AQY3_9BACT|nr:hypothetical protein [Aeoliella mucimassa]QDU57128.1 hypothetical protein Pan181_33420 [Aeoliella mucimassa]
MDDQIVIFCQDRRSWLIVIAGTLLLGLVFVLPEVDDYIALCNEKSEIAEKLALAEESARMLPGFETRYSEQTAKAEEQRNKTLNENNEAEFRNAIVKMVRDSGCQLRRLNVGSPVSREWGHDDDPLEKNFNRKLTPTTFQLERRQVTLSLAGPSNSVRRLIESFEQNDKQVHVQTLDLKPSTGDGSRVELSLELWYFTLARKTA